MNSNDQMHEVWYGNLMNKMCEIQKEGFKQEIFYGFMGVFLTLK